MPVPVVALAHAGELGIEAFVHGLVIALIAYRR